MTAEQTVDEVTAEVEAIDRDRTRMVEAAAAHPELDHWKLPGQLAALDRHLARLKALL